MRLFALSHRGEEGIGGSDELLDVGPDSSLPLVALLDEGGTCSAQGVDFIPELSRNGVRVQLDLFQIEKLISSPKPCMSW